MLSHRTTLSTSVESGSSFRMTQLLQLPPVHADSALPLMQETVTGAARARLEDSLPQLMDSAMSVVNDRRRLYHDYDDDDDDDDAAGITIDADRQPRHQQHPCSSVYRNNDGQSRTDSLRHRAAPYGTASGVKAATRGTAPCTVTCRFGVKEPYHCDTNWPVTNTPLYIAPYEHCKGPFTLHARAYVRSRLLLMSSLTEDTCVSERNVNGP